VAYDEHLADRIRAALATTPDLSERKMFGGLAFMVAERATAHARTLPPKQAKSR
jgi:hypothetical protein